MVYVKDIGNKMISRKAMGLQMDIGSLYDTVNDCCAGSSIFKKGIDHMKNHLIVQNCDRKKLKYAKLEKHSDLFEFLDIDLEQRASLLAGMIKPVGACKIINDEFNADQLFLKYSVRNKVSKLNIYEPDALKTIGEKIIGESKSEATHLVVGIVYGVDIVISYEARWTDSASEKYVLPLIFEQFENALKEGNARSYINSEIKYVSTVSTKVFTDVVDEELPTVADLSNTHSANYLRSSLLLICLTEPTKICIPQVYLLLPISAILSQMGQSGACDKDRLYITSNAGKIREALSTLNELDIKKREFITFEALTDVLGHHVFSDEMFRNIAEFGKEMEISLAKLKSRFKKWLLTARTRTVNISNYQLQSTDVSATKIATFTQRYSTENVKMRWIAGLAKKGIAYLQKEDKLTREIISYEEVYLFRYERAIFDTLEWKEAFEKFSLLLPGTNKFKPNTDSSNQSGGMSYASSIATTVDLLAGSTAYLVFENVDESGISNLFEDGPSQENECQYRVEYYQNGQLVNSKVLDLFQPPTCKWDSGFDSEPRNSSFGSSAVVVTVCPGFLAGRCNENEKVKWICEGCSRYLEFNFSGTFSCGCGRGPVGRCSFKCNSLSAGVQYVKPDKDISFSLKTSLKPRREMNLIVMGETGVGKSTFINAFANYLTYSTLEEAEASDLIALIPASFTVSAADFQTKRVTIGQDENEIREVGASQTQFCKCYTFPSDDKVVRIIDTPGIGDTRGVSYDEANFENILSFISNYHSIQGILLLLKPNNSRLSIFFRFCIQQLLCHLHKSASNNVVFVYTNARGTFYRPGDTHPPLKELLLGIERKEPYVKIKLERPTIYCLDNESFRFLVAIKNGLNFTNEHRLNFSDSWIQSVSECNRLFEYITELKPHVVSETISLNQVRKLILTLAKPIGDISQNIQLNISHLQEQQIKIQLAMNDIHQLQQYLYVPIFDLEPVAFLHPRTVCTAPECVQIYNVDGVQKIDYAQICHNHCYLKGVQPEVMNNGALRFCSAMGGSQTHCVLCKCSYEKHMHIYYENKLVQKHKVDNSIKNEISDKSKRLEKVQQFMSQLQDRVELLKSEQKQIMKTSAKFGQFLRKSAITPYNDALKDYMDYLISVEEQKSSADPEKKALIAELKQMKLDYEHEIKIIENSIECASNGDQAVIDQLTLEDIKQTLDDLFQLRVNGPTIQRMVDIMQTGHSGEHSNVAEKVYQPIIEPNPKTQQYKIKKNGFVKKFTNRIQTFFGFKSKLHNYL